MTESLQLIQLLKPPKLSFICANVAVDFVLGALRSYSIKCMQIILVLSDVVQCSVNISLAFWVLLSDALVRLDWFVCWYGKVLLRHRLFNFLLLNGLHFDNLLWRRFAVQGLQFDIFARWKNNSRSHEFWEGRLVGLTKMDRSFVICSLGLSITEIMYRRSVTWLVLVWRFYFHVLWKIKLLILELCNRWDMIRCL